MSRLLLSVWYIIHCFTLWVHLCPSACLLPPRLGEAGLSQNPTHYSFKGMPGNYSSGNANCLKTQTMETRGGRSRARQRQSDGHARVRAHLFGSPYFSQLIDYQFVHTCRLLFVCIYPLLGFLLFVHARTWTNKKNSNNGYISPFNTVGLSQGLGFCVQDFRALGSRVRLFSDQMKRVSL